MFKSTNPYIIWIKVYNETKNNLPNDPVKGEGKVFYSAEEVTIALNEKSVDLHAKIKIKITNALEGDKLVTKHSILEEYETGVQPYYKQPRLNQGIVNDTFEDDNLRFINLGINQPVDEHLRQKL